MNETTTTTTLAGAAPTGLLRALLTCNHGVVEGPYTVGNGAGTSSDGVGGKDNGTRMMLAESSGMVLVEQSYALVAGACSVADDTGNGIGYWSRFQTGL